MDKLDFDLVHNGKIFKISANMELLLSDIVKTFQSDKNYVYSLFMEQYLPVEQTILDLNLKSGDVIFL